MPIVRGTIRNGKEQTESEWIKACKEIDNDSIVLVQFPIVDISGSVNRLSNLKKEKNIKLCRIIYFILSPICLITLITNIFVIYGFDKVNNIIKDYSSFKSYYLPLIICIGFLIILFIVMFFVSRNRLKEVKENKS